MALHMSHIPEHSGLLFPCLAGQRPGRSYSKALTLSEAPRIKFYPPRSGQSDRALSVSL